MSGAEQPVPQLRPVVIVTAGGEGSGRTTSLDRLQNDAELVYDADIEDGSPIQQALNSGRCALVAYTYRDPEEALIGGMLKRATRQEQQLGSGRMVPIDSIVETFLSVTAMILILVERYKTDPRVHFVVIDNSRGKACAKHVGLGEAYRDLGDRARAARSALADLPRGVPGNKMKPSKGEMSQAKSPTGSVQEPAANYQFTLNGVAVTPEVWWAHNRARGGFAGGEEFRGWSEKLGAALVDNLNKRVLEEDAWWAAAETAAKATGMSVSDWCKGQREGRNKGVHPRDWFKAEGDR